MTRIRFEGITKKFGDFVALHETNLVIEPGEFFTLLGPSGSGKSTLLRILTGLEIPTSGKLWFGDDDVTNVPAYKRNTAMVFQNYALYPHMTVAQNIGYPLKIRKLKPAEINPRVEEVAGHLQISHLLERRPGEISGGQQQRVALARALANKPRIFLFDEPLSNLDAKLRGEARTFLKALQRELGITSIYVTHDQTEAMALSDRMAVLEFGSLRQVGTPAEVYHTPATPFVATFVGHPPANILEVEVVGGEVQLAGVPLGQSSGQSSGDGPMLLGARPEYVSWAPEGPGAQAKVVVSEDFGHEVWVTLDVGGQRLVMRSHEVLEADKPVHVSIDLSRARLFPRP
jgi:ABC-type sugar transport system ATPase subunit